nr:unnamed protein product [Callosobruchus chinensis]
MYEDYDLNLTFSHLQDLTTKELLDMVGFWEADIYITPPADGHHQLWNHLSGRQLRAPAIG